VKDVLLESVKVAVNQCIMLGSQPALMSFKSVLLHIGGTWPSNGVSLNSAGDKVFRGTTMEGGTNYITDPSWRNIKKVF